MRGKYDKSACSVVSHRNFHTVSAEWKPERRKELRWENHSVLTLGELTVPLQRAWKHDRDPQKLWLTCPCFCPRCTGGWDAIVKDTVTCFKKKQTTAACRGYRQSDFVDVDRGLYSVFSCCHVFCWCLCFKISLLHASPIVFCFLTAGKARLIHMSRQKIQASLW